MAKYLNFSIFDSLFAAECKMRPNKKPNQDNSFLYFQPKANILSK